MHEVRTTPLMEFSSRNSIRASALERKRCARVLDGYWSYWMGLVMMNGWVEVRHYSVYRE